MFKIVPLAALLVLAIAPRQAAGARVPPTRGVALAGGVRLTIAVGKPVYPRNALVRVRATLVNVSRRMIYFPIGCNGRSNPVFSVLNGRNLRVDPPHVLVPAPHGPIVASCMAPIPRPVPPGHSLHWAVLRILRGRRLSVRVGLSGAPHAIFPTWYITSRLQIQLTAPDRPSVGVWTIPRVSAFVHPQGDVAGPLRVAGWWLCPGDNPANGAPSLPFTAANPSNIAPPCLHPVQWHAVAGWLDHSVVAIDYPITRMQSREDDIHESISASGRSLCAAATATGVVRAYFAALNRHQAAAAKACLTLAHLAQARKVVDPDWKNVISARIVELRVRSISDRLLPPDVTPPPFRAEQVGARVLMLYRQIYGSSDGLNVWFIYVIKQHATSPWRIADLGSGP